MALLSFSCLDYSRVTYILRDTFEMMFAEDLKTYQNNIEEEIKAFC